MKLPENCSRPSSDDIARARCSPKSYEAALFKCLEVFEREGVTPERVILFRSSDDKFALTLTVRGRHGERELYANTVIV